MLPSLLKGVRLLLIAALLTSCGAHWVALQSLAWTTMLVGRARDSSFLEAVKETFDGAHPCSLCQQVEAGRKSETKRAPAVLTASIELFYQPPAPFVAPVRSARDLALTGEGFPVRSWRPPLPPPRGC